MKQFTIKFNICVLALFLTVFSSATFSQNQTSKPFYFHLTTSYQYNFGPDSKQVEFTGGVDSISYDNKIHLVPGFKAPVPVELTMGYSHPRGYYFEGFISCYKSDIGLSTILGSHEQKLMDADMLTFKVGLGGNLNAKNSSSLNGFYIGLAFGGTVPVNYYFNEVVQDSVGIKSFDNSILFHISFDAAWSHRIGKGGCYFVITESMVLPGLLFNSLGSFTMNPSDAYTCNNESFRMYTVKLGIGVGYRFGSAIEPQITK